MFGGTAPFSAEIYAVLALTFALTFLCCYIISCCGVQEEMMSVEVRIDHRVHSRLIGARGRAISKIMDEFKVDIRMPGREAEDPDLVIITGRPDDVDDCQHHLLNLEEEYVCSRCFVVSQFPYVVFSFRKVRSMTLCC